MEKAKKNAKVLLCLAIVLMFLSGIVVSGVQTNGWKIKMKELTFETDEGFYMTAYLFIPPNATEETPAPAVVTSHGYLNNKEMTDANYVELARRGFVVLAIDQPDHGDSEVTDKFHFASTGIYDAVQILSRMPFVDVARIGVTGHSMGGMSTNSAVKLDEANGTHLIAAALVHCADPLYQDDNGAYANPYGNRDVGVIAAVYDEFFGRTRDADGKVIKYAPYFMETPMAQCFLNFGKDPAQCETRQAYTYYTENIDGKETFRVIYHPPIIHPWSHFSARSESYVCEFFDKALDAPVKIDPSNQVWQVKEAFNFIGLIGMVLFICSFTVLMLFTPLFSPLRAKEVVKPRPVDKKGRTWFWVTSIIGAVLCTVIYIPILKFGTGLKVNQVEAMGLGLWSALCGVITIALMLISYFAYGKKHGMNLEEAGVKLSAKKLGLSLLLGFIVFVVTYLIVFTEDYFFYSDFRLWTLAIKAFDAPILKCWPYMLLFLPYYISASVSNNAFNYNTVGGKANGIILSLFAAFPALILPWIQYIHYYSAKTMMWPASNMHILWLFPIVLILIGSTLITRYIYKRCQNPYIAGFINALMVGLLTITNTCTTLM